MSTRIHKNLDKLCGKSCEEFNISYEFALGLFIQDHSKCLSFVTESESLSPSAPPLKITPLKTRKQHGKQQTRQHDAQTTRKIRKADSVGTLHSAAKKN